MQVTGLKGFHLSLQQARLWTLQGESQVYRVQCALRIDGPFGLKAFQQAVQWTMSQHSILRTSFYHLPGKELPLQVIHPCVETDYMLIDGTNLLETTHNVQIQTYFAQMQREYVDLTRCPLLRIRFLRLAVHVHIILVSLPALCADETTLRLFVTEVSQRYSHALQGIPWQEVGEGPLQYADVAAWQDELLQEEAERPRHFWANIDLSRLSNMPLPLATERKLFPAAGPRPTDGASTIGASSYHCRDNPLWLPWEVGVIKMPLEPALAERVYLAAVQSEVSLAAYFCTCWSILYYRLTQEPHLLLGVACDGRFLDDLTSALGHYARYVPLEIYFSDNFPFERVLALVSTSLEDAYQEQVSFVWTHSSPEKNIGDSSYFPVSFEYHTWPQSFDADTLSWKLLKRWSCTEPFVLKLSVLQVGEHIQLEVQYDPQRMERLQVERLVALFLTLLEGATTHPETSIGGLPLLTVDEQASLLTRSYAKVGSLPRMSIHQLIERQAQQWSDHPAVMSAGECLTYQQLNEQANRLARVLQKRGVGPNTLVGLCMARSAQMLVGLLAILKAGGAYLPLDMQSPLSRLVYQLQQSQTPLLLTQRGLLAPLPAWSEGVLYLEDLEQEMVLASAENVSGTYRPEDLAYVIYTSGSTGQPKGVMVQHCSLVNYTLALCERLEVEPGWRYATVSTLAADLGNTAIFCALVSGGCVQILDSEIVTSADAMTKHSIDVLKIVPSHLSALLASEHGLALLPRRALVLGGEALSTSLLERLWQVGGSCQIYNHYGPTETTIGVLVQPLGKLSPSSGEGVLAVWSRGAAAGGMFPDLPSLPALVPLGRPITNTEVYVLDRRMQVVPVGVTGELYIAGAGLALGYIGQPEQTAERFVPHPFVAAQFIALGARLYRTGDLARYNADGTLEFVGRRDRQVKLRGYRIELVEIEAALNQHPSIRTCVVVLWEDLPREPRLLAYYVVARPHLPLSPEQLSHFLRQSLPEYMVPTLYIQVDTLPLTANGKVDWQKLPTPDLRSERERAVVALPRSPIEEMLVQMWEELLAIPVVGIHDNFFALGGHSLLAMQVMARLQAVLQTTLPIQLLFDEPTVAELAPRIELVLRKREGHSQPPVEQVHRLQAATRPQEIPLSFEQQRLWFLDQLQPASTAYLSTQALHLQGNVHAQALEQSLQALVQRHESLRTTFEVRTSQPVQVIHSLPTRVKSSGGPGGASMPGQPQGIAPICVNGSAQKRGSNGQPAPLGGVGTPQTPTGEDPCTLTKQDNALKLTHMGIAPTMVRRGATGQSVHCSGKPLWLPYGYVLPVIDLQGLEQARQRGEAQRLIVQEASRPCHLAVGPLLRTYLLRLVSVPSNGSREDIGSHRSLRGRVYTPNPNNSSENALEIQEHVMLLTLHHIISDDWSHRIFVRELTTFYQAYASDLPTALAPLPIQYADYALWQQQWLQGEILDTQLAYWRKQLADLPHLQLPTDYPRPMIHTHRGASQQRLLPQVLSEGLAALSRSTHVTLFMILLSAFQVLLLRYTGQSDISVGVPVANRRQAELEGLIGFFVNTLALRTDLSDNPPFVQALQRVRQVCLAAYTHQDIPFEKVVDALQPQRDLSRSPLFQVMFALQHAESVPTHVSEMHVKPWIIESTISKFDLTLVLTETEQGLHCVLQYCTDLFTPQTMARLLTHFQTLLEGIVRDPQMSISDLPLLTHIEREQVLVQWNATQTDYPRNLCIHQLFERQVEHSPDAVALVFEHEVLTYAQLNRRANQLAHRLQMLGVGPETLVGVCLQRSLEMGVALLAVLKAGGAYLPLDPTDPSERLAFLLQDAQAQLILTRSDLLARLPHNTVAQLLLDRDWLESTHLASHNMPVYTTPQSLAYVMYTSGSTGRPKGIAIVHQAVVRLVCGNNSIRLTATDRLVQVSNVAFDAATFEIWGALLNGSCLVIFPAGPVALSEVGRIIEHSQVTTLFLTTGFFHQMVEHHLTQLASVRQLLTGGEVLSVRHVQQMLGMLKDSRLINCYGPTENTTFTCRYVMDQQSEVQGSVPIGRPISNTQVYVLDAQCQLVPPGAIGELYAGGDGLARGYFDRPDLTAEKFVPHPFSQSAGARLYRTGDRVRYREDGILEYVGRIDQQVKIRGHRIEPGEIEATLMRHPAIKDCAVLVQEDEKEKRLVAYPVVRQGYTLTNRELQAYLQERLPTYMIPFAFIPLSALPLTSNGKLDRQALPTPENGRDEQTRQQEVPRTPIEDLLMELWRDVLGCKQVGRHDNFFDLGGHSLLATRLIAHLCAMLGVEVPLRAVFEAPTIAALAQRAEQVLSKDAARQIPPLVAMQRPQELPLSFAQQRLWFLDQLEPGSTAYLVPHAYHFEADLHLQALEWSLQEVIRRHETLRTTFEQRAGQAVQVIHPEANPLLPVIDLQWLQPMHREQVARQLAGHEANHPCDLTKGPLLRISLLRLQQQKHIILLTLHHIITDGWSSTVFVHELVTLYRTNVARQQTTLPPLPIQYADYTLWQRQLLQGPLLDAQLAYWRKQLAEVSPIPLPTDHPRPAIQSYRGARQEQQLPPMLSEGLIALSRSCHVTLFMTLLSAFQVLLLRYTGQNDICVGTPLANRRQAELEGLIGFFVNTLVMRADLGGDPTFLQVLAQTRETALQAYTHQDIPFEKIVEALQPERDLSRSPLFQVMFVLQHAELAPAELLEAGVRPLAVESTMSKFDLTLAIAETEQGLRCSLEYCTDLFESESIARLLAHWQTLLEGIVQNPQQHISALPLLTPAERDLMLLRWNATQCELPQDLCLHQLFEQQVQETPDAVALVFENETLTYDQLNRRANQLAHHLQTLGVGPEVLVAVCMQRCPAIIVALLAVLKAGGAYAPLDPKAPQAQLTGLLQQMRVKLVLVDEVMRGQLQHEGVMLLSLQDHQPVFWQHHATNLPCATIPWHLAYAIFTSGSTGRAKGVLISHANVVHATLARFSFYQEKVERYLLLSPLSFDSSVAGLYWTLCQGGTLVLPHEALYEGLDQLPTFIAQQNIGHMLSIASLYAAVLAQGQAQELSSLRTVIVAGESCPLSLLEQHRAMLPQTLFSNEYGPTEATVWSSAYQDQGQACVGRVPIGRPIANTQIYLLQEAMYPVPIGMVAELCLGGLGIARGYLDQADLTAEKFVPCPIGSNAGERIYRTGDLARYQPDGTIEYVGRLDQQVKVRGYRIELGEIEAALLHYPGTKEVAVSLWQDPSHNKKLVAYIVVDDAKQISTDELRHYLQENLPAYMVPAIFVPLPQLPRLLNGKLDQAALPAPSLQEPKDIPAPRTALEQALVALWTEVLQTPQIGLRDNFFELGGDSILSLQMVARGKQRGLHFTSKQLFQHQTIEQLSRTVEVGTHVLAEQGPVVGTVPLTPIQHWFFELHLSAPHHWNQALFLQVGEQIGGGFLQEVVAVWLRQHDVLRLRFVPEQVLADPNTHTLPLVIIDLQHLSHSEQDLTATRLAQETQASLNLREGPLLRVILFDRGRGRTRLLLIVIHHLAVDGVSWRILLEDLQIASTQRVLGEPIKLPAKTSSFKTWAEHLVQYARSDAIREEQSYWLARTLEQTSPLPLDDPSHGRQSTVAATAVVSRTLTEEETLALLSRVPAIYHTQMNEVLLTALAWTLVQWTDEPAVLIDLEGHGRQDLFVGVDVSRTVGWFTSVFPLRLDLKGIKNVKDALTVVKEQVRAVPHHGIGYGILRYLSTDRILVEQLQRQRQAEVSFNYLGQFDQTLSNPLVVDWSPLAAGPMHHLQDKRTHLLDITCQIRNGQLAIFWSYSQDTHTCATIEWLATTFVDTLCMLLFNDNPLAERHAALVSVHPAFTSRLEIAHTSIEAITTLSPAQEGMLYETMQAPASGIHIEQSIYTLTGKLDLAAFERAWQWAIERHAMLRTGFVWQGQVEPLQVTYRQGRVALTFQDWRGVSATVQQVCLANYLRQERVLGFELSRPPLIRLTLLRFNAETSCFVWTGHHMVLDGWSYQVLVSEIMEYYSAQSLGQALHLAPARPYYDYIAWLKGQDLSQAEQFWRKTLSGFTQPTPLGREESGVAANGAQKHHESLQLQLPLAVATSVQAVARHRHLTLNSVIQGVWAILLSRYSGSQDVVFGVTVSGRPPELEGVETMIGLCINTLPVRVQLPATASLWSWLADLQQHNVEMHRFEYSPGGQIHQWSDVPGRLPLYESLLVIENYPKRVTNTALARLSISVSDIRSIGAQTKYALTFLVTVGTRLDIQCIYDTQRFERAAIAHLLHHFQQVLSYLASDPEGELALLYNLIPEDEIPRVTLPAVVESEEKTHRTPSGPIEEVVANVWRDVLGLAQIGMETNFFIVGGHSLIATQAISRLQAMLGVEVPLRAIFEAPTVARLAELIENLLRKDQRIQIPPLVVMERPQELPLSFAQQRLWFLDQLEPETTTYLASQALHLQGDLHVQALQQSLQDLIQRHETLRTTFEIRGGQPVQVVHPFPYRGSGCVLPVVDLQELMPEQREAEVQRLINSERRRPCDLAKGPLLRAYLLRLARQEHILLLTLHHIITDGWSSTVLEYELTTLYRAHSSEKPTALAPLPIQYADYALWQREWLQDEILDAQLAYWREQLAEVSPMLLPTDHARPPIQTYRGAIQARLLPAALSEGLITLSRSVHVTLYMTLLSAFQVLLSRYTGQNDICVGTPIANRRQAELEGLIGFFVNTLVMRADLGGDPTFLQVLAQTRETALQAYTHQDIPFEKIVEALQPERDLSRSPLFQVMFILQNVPRGLTELAGVTATPLMVESPISKFDLTLSLTETEQGLHCVLQYNTDLFAATTIARLLTHFQTLLEGIVQDPQARLSDLSLLTEAEQTQLLVTWNATQCDSSPRECCVHQLFEQQVERTPDAIAVVFEDHHLTYAILNQRANQLGHYLQALGVSPEVRVGIRLRRSLWLPVVVLAILKAGGAYVPLDPAWPLTRLVALIQDARLTILMTSKQEDELAGAGVQDLLLIEQVWQTHELQEASNVNVKSLVMEHNLAYIVSTSGSTGRPKGVLSTHAGVVNYLHYVTHTSQLTADTVVLQLPPLSFDASVRDIFATLLVGGRLVLVGEEEYRDMQTLVDRLQQQKVTALLSIVPSFLSALLDVADTLQQRCPSVELVLVSGESLALEVVNHAQRVFSPDLQVINQYGPTETTMTSMFTPVSPSLQDRGLAPLGRPIPNMQAYVLDHQLSAVPIGVVGEIYLSGIGLSRGYMDQTAATAEKFVPLPVAAQFIAPGARMYRTGDLGRYLPNGQIEFLGRKDTQVKLRGLRIELAEIEAVLREYGAFEACAVLLREDEPGEQRLVAYLIVQPGQALQISALRSYLQDRLPTYMIPSAFVSMPVFPLLPNGKLNRRALPVPDVAASESHVQEEARTPLEDLLAGLWCQMLGRESIGRHDNFFALGGHSLLATKLIGRVRAMLTVEVPLRTLFETPTVAEFAAAIEEIMRKDQGVEIPPLLKVTRPEQIPLSFAQQRLWFLDQLEPGSTTYLMSHAYRLYGSLDEPCLQSSLHALIERHESLRTTFVQRADQVVQVIHDHGMSYLNGIVPCGCPGGGAVLPMIDLQGLAAAQREQEIQRLAGQEANHPCDLAVGPLLRTALLRLAEQEHVMLLTLHHIITDGWSMEVLVHEMSILYQAEMRREPAPLPKLAIQYADYALWQHQWLQGEVLDAHIAYWKRQLAGAPTQLHLPTDRPRPAIPSSAGAQLSSLLPLALLQQLRALSQREGVTLFMTGFAAFNVLLHYYTGQEDLVVGTGIANRNRIEIEGLIGFLVNQLALRTDLSGNPSFVEVMQRVRKVSLEAYAHQDLPFERLVEALNPERNLSYTPLFQVKFILQNVPAQKSTLDALTVRPLALGQATAKFDILLSMSESSDGLFLSLEYRTDLFNAETMKQFLRQFEYVMYQIVALPEIPLERIRQALAAANREAEGRREQDLQQMSLQKLGQVRRVRNVKMPRVN